MRKKTKSVLQIVLILFSVVMLLPVVLTMLFSFFAPEMAEQLLQQGSTVQRAALRGRGHGSLAAINSAVC